MRGVFKCSNESGRSMVEMLGVLAIVGVLSIGGIAGYSKAMAKYKINKTLDQVSMLITNVRTAFGNQASYDGLKTATAISYQLVGNDLTLGSTTKLTNAFNGGVTVEAVCGTGDDAEYCPSFEITYTDIEQTACGTIASSDWGGNAASGLLKISINGTDYTWGGQTNELPIGFADAMEACNATDGKNDIVWEYN